jgi:hypothetical protein
LCFSTFCACADGEVLDRTLCRFGAGRWHGTHSLTSPPPPL